MMDLLQRQNRPSRRPKVRSPDEHIIAHIDLRDRKSIDRFFKMKKGFGRLKPIPSVLGAQANWRDCFKNIRAWRELTHGQQESKKQAYRALSRDKKAQFIATIDFLMALKEGNCINTSVVGDCNNGSGASGAAVPTDNEESLSRGDGAGDGAGDGGVVVAKDPPVASSHHSRKLPSLRNIVNNTMPTVRRLHEKVASKVLGATKHIGLVSSKEDRARKIDEVEKEAKSGKAAKKPRKRGVRPQFAYQAGDTVGKKAFFDVLKYFGIFSDTVTMIEKDCSNARKGSLPNNKNINDGKPRNMAVMMILNEVVETSMNGGGSREKMRSRRVKPEFVLVSDNKADCFKVLTAFKNIFSRDEKENKKENYDLKWFQRDEESGLLTTTLERHIGDDKKKRSSGKKQKVVTLESIEKEIGNDELLGSTIN